jgi:hypothetical protein
MIMSTIGSVVPALDGRTAWKRPRPPVADTVAGAVRLYWRLYWEALRDGLEASRRYNELTTHGVAHDAAVRQVFAEHFDARR